MKANLPRNEHKHSVYKHLLSMIISLGVRLEDKF